MTVPEVYRDFWEDYRRDIGECCFYTLDEMVTINAVEETEEYAPGYVIIGDDNGDLRFLMRSEESARSVYVSDVGDLRENGFEKAADDFASWVQGECRLPCRREASSRKYRIILKKYSDDMKRSLLAVKKVMGLPMSVGELFSAARNAPVTLLSDVSEGSVVWLKGRLAQFSDILIFEGQDEQPDTE